MGIVFSLPSQCLARCRDNSKELTVWGEHWITNQPHKAPPVLLPLPISMGYADLNCRKLLDKVWILREGTALLPSPPFPCSSRRNGFAVSVEHLIILISNPLKNSSSIRGTLLVWLHSMLEKSSQRQQELPGLQELLGEQDQLKPTCELKFPHAGIEIEKRGK